MVNNRRFPPLWRADRIPGGYVVRDVTAKHSFTSTRATTRPSGARALSPRATVSPTWPSLGIRVAHRRIGTAP